MIDIKIKSLVGDLSETLNTKGWASPEFGEILVNLNQVYQAASPIRPIMPNMPQANGLTGGVVPIYPKEPLDLKKP